MRCPRLLAMSAMALSALSHSTSAATGDFAQANEQATTISTLFGEIQNGEKGNAIAIAHIGKKDQCPGSFVDVRDARVDGQLSVVTSDEVAEIIGSINRTEDVAVSPDGKRLAIAAFSTQEICMLSFNIPAHDGAIVEVGSAITSGADDLKSPHGVAFLDDYTLIVANRDSDIMIAHLDPESGMKIIESHVLIDDSHAVPVRTPGSVAVHAIAGALVEVIVCNNYANDVTRYLLDGNNDWEVVNAERLLAKDLATPDGVAISASGKWIAISNHVSNEVFMYDNTAELDVNTPPTGVLKNVNAPHGLQFADNDRVLLVADAGLPYVRIYESLSADWSGERNSIATRRIMTDEAFISGNHNLREGGPKGLQIVENRFVVLTSEFEPLAFFRVEHLANLHRSRGGIEQNEAPSALEAERMIARLVRRLAAQDEVNKIISLQTAAQKDEFRKIKRQSLQLQSVIAAQEEEIKRISLRLQSVNAINALRLESVIAIYEDEDGDDDDDDDDDGKVNYAKIVNIDRQVVSIDRHETKTVFSLLFGDGVIHEVDLNEEEFRIVIL